MSALKDGYRSEVVDDRRRSPRYPVRLPVTLVAAGGTRPSVWGHTVDICLRGVRVVTANDVCRDVELTAFLEVGGGEPPIIAGIEPVWTTRRGEQWVHGMVLRGVSDDDDARIRALCVPGRQGGSPP